MVLESFFRIASPVSVSGSQDLAVMVYIVYYGCFEAIENGIASIISFLAGSSLVYKKPTGFIC